MSADKIIKLDERSIQESMEIMDAKLLRVQQAVEDYNVDIDTLHTMPRDDVKRISADLNSIEKEANDARISFEKLVKRQITEPVKAAYNKELSQLQAIASMYKIERQARDAREQDERIAYLEQCYTEFLEDNDFAVLKENVPFGTIFEKAWLLGGKRWNSEEMREKLETKVVAVLHAYKILESSDIEYKDAAIIEFFNSLDYGRALQAAAEAKDKAEKLEAMRQRVEAAPAQVHEERYTLYTIHIRNIPCDCKEEVTRFLDNRGIQYDVAEYRC